MEEQQNTRVRRTSVEIKKLLKEFTDGGLTTKEFCILHNITEAVFHKWRSRYSDVLSKNRDGFVALKQTGSGRTLNEMLFAEVKGIRIYQAVSAAYLKELLA